MSARHSTRVAAASVSVLFAAGALAAAAPATAADEATSTLYNCTMMGQTIPLVATPTAAVSIPPLASGFVVPADSAEIGVAFTIPAAVLAGLQQQAHSTAAGVSTDDFAFRIGSAGSVPVQTLTAANTAIPSDGSDLTLPTAANNAAITIPAAGTYDLLMPATFDAVLTTDTTGDLLSGPCSIADGDGPVLGSMTVNKQDSTIAKAAGPKKAIQKGKPAKISVVVNGAFKTATGKVVAKEGKKVVGSAPLKKGKAKISVKGLKPGTHTLVVSYGGDASTNPAGDSFPITVKVKK
ncbi:Ig-like domain repeat protein [Nocardioides mangrovi]|uniref:Ig-like domain repeat protein n=1 Tax=Nocardioides mangrovi TaxID=2874580 RepID=A0ABS7U922_9ACTN|nr:Ig-like domain repeat protein [Nocardioides mangrovi]MBZ5737362.1 Ig-like domain repeat protein [Nocardioides mangrovi]